MNVPSGVLQLPRAHGAAAEGLQSTVASACLPYHQCRATRQSGALKYAGS